MSRSKRRRQEEPEEQDDELDEEEEELVEEASEEFTEAILIAAEASIINYEARRYEDVMNSVNSARDALASAQADLFPDLVKIIEELANAVELLATPLPSEYEEEEEDE